MTAPDLKDLLPCNEAFKEWYIDIPRGKLSYENAFKAGYEAAWQTRATSEAAPVEVTVDGAEDIIYPILLRSGIVDRSRAGVVDLGYAIAEALKGIKIIDGMGEK